MAAIIRPGLGGGAPGLRHSPRWCAEVACSSTAALELQHRAPLLIERINFSFGRLVSPGCAGQGLSLIRAEPAGLHSLRGGPTSDDARFPGIADSQLREALARLGRAVAETKGLRRVARGSEAISIQPYVERNVYAGDLDRCSRDLGPHLCRRRIRNDTVASAGRRSEDRASDHPGRRVLGNPAPRSRFVEYASLDVHTGSFTTMSSRAQKAVDRHRETRLVLCATFRSTEPSLARRNDARCAPPGRFYALPTPLRIAGQVGGGTKDYREALARLAKLGGMGKEIRLLPQ